MKILITSIVDLKNSQHNRPHQFVKYLSKHHEITILSINDWWKAKQDNLNEYSNDFSNIFNGVNILHLTERKISPILQEIFSARKVNEVMREDFDVHLNYSTLRSGYIAAKGLNTVYDIADDLSAMIRESPQIPKLLRPMGGSIGDLLIKKNINISKIITVTNDSLISSYNIPKKKSKVIPNGVDTYQFRDYGDVMREKLKLDGFIIGYVGVLREWVNFEPIFKALRDLPKNIKLLVVGREGRFAETRDLAKSYRISDRVIFAGMISYSEVPKYISAMDICIIPFNQSHISKNALPLKLFEYMACSRPVISAELPEVKRVVGSFGDCVLFAESAEDYKKQIYMLYEDDCKRYKMGKYGRRLVESKYDWNMILNHFETILEDTAFPEGYR